jgi:hypothetical protein
MAPPADGDPLSALAYRMLAARHQRDHFFDPLVFGNPAWEMLLTLFVAGERGRPVLDASLSTGVPQSVALRWLTYLQREKMLVEVEDPDHGPETLIRLTDKSRAAIRSYLGALVEPGLAA